MKARADFVRAVGERLMHCTARTNLGGIATYGLLPPAMLARLAGQDPKRLALRRDRLVLTMPDGSTAQLNHQLPILHGLAAANRVVDGHDAISWACQLDERVFLWPQSKGDAFMKSVARDSDITCLSFDSGAVFDLCAERLWLSPLNSGNFRQGGAHARRGDWIYCRASDGITAFRNNRRDRGLVAGTDALGEVSLTCGGLTVADLADLKPEGL